MALSYGIETLIIIVFLSEWGPFKKYLVSITHKYAMAVERIYKLSKYLSNRRFNRLNFILYEILLKL